MGIVRPGVMEGCDGTGYNGFNWLGTWREHAITAFWEHVV